MTGYLKIEAIREGLNVECHIRKVSRENKLSVIEAVMHVFELDMIDKLALLKLIVTSDTTSEQIIAMDLSGEKTNEC